MAFKNGAVANDQTLCGHIADDRTRRLHLEFFFRNHIGHDLSLDEDRGGRDFTFYGRLLADRNMGLRDDFAFNFAVDRCLAVEVQFAVDLGAGAEVSA